MSRADTPIISSYAFGTFGVYRYILASIVISTHTMSHDWSWRFYGPTAVFSFFMLSGYVISYILHHHYLKQYHGWVKFSANRFLRIYPLYWLTGLASLAFIRFFHIHMADFNPHFLFFKNTSADWFSNITTFTLSHPVTGGLISKTTIVPSGWSLGTEILYWMILVVCVNNIPARIILASFAMLYTVFILITLPYPLHNAVSYLPGLYWSPMAASLPFCVGLYWFIGKSRYRLVIPHWLGWIGMGAFPLLIYYTPYLSTSWLFVFYTGIGVNALVIAYLSGIGVEQLPTRLRAIDRFLGNLAYPIFLVHMPIIAALHFATPSLLIDSWIFFFFVLLISSLIGMTLHFLIEEPINRWRRNIKYGL